jgi:hypothetical protein
MKSLLGKDEDFVIARVQAMMRNEEIEIFRSDLDKLKEDPIT